VITFTRFRKEYGPHVAVEDLSLQIRRGESLALLGPNGSGKSTTLKAAAGLIRPTSGEVLLGESGRKCQPAVGAQSVSFLRSGSRSQTC
jgi:Cu-processing system ATP-binding protein